MVREADGKMYAGRSHRQKVPKTFKILSVEHLKPDMNPILLEVTWNNYVGKHIVTLSLHDLYNTTVINNIEVRTRHVSLSLKLPITFLMIVLLILTSSAHLANILASSIFLKNCSAKQLHTGPRAKLIVYDCQRKSKGSI